MDRKANEFLTSMEQQNVHNEIFDSHKEVNMNVDNSQQVINGPIYKNKQRRFNYFKRRKPYRKTKKTSVNETKSPHVDVISELYLDKNGKLVEAINSAEEWNVEEEKSLDISKFNQRTNKPNRTWGNYLVSKLHNATHTINRKFFSIFRICSVYPEYMLKGELKKTLELQNRELVQLHWNETLQNTEQTNFPNEKMGKGKKKRTIKKKSRNLCCRQFENDLNALNYQNIELDSFDTYNNDTNEHTTDIYSNYNCTGKDSMYYESLGMNPNLGNISSCTSVQSMGIKERMINYHGMINNDPNRQMNPMHTNSYTSKWEDSFYSPDDLFASDMQYEPTQNQNPFMYNQTKSLNNFENNMCNEMMNEGTYQGPFSTMNPEGEQNHSEKWNNETQCKTDVAYGENENEAKDKNEKPKEYQNIKHFYIASVSKTTNRRRLRKISLMELYCDPYFFILEHFLTDLESYLALNHCLIYVQKNQDELAQIHDTFYTTLIDVDEVEFLEREVTTSILRHILKRLNQMFQIPISEVKSLEFCLYLKNEPRENGKKKSAERKIKRSVGKKERVSEKRKDNSDEKPEIEKENETTKENEGETENEENEENEVQNEEEQPKEDEEEYENNLEKESDDVEKSDISEKQEIQIEEESNESEAKDPEEEEEEEEEDVHIEKEDGEEKNEKEVDEEVEKNEEEKEQDEEDNMDIEKENEEDNMNVENENEKDVHEEGEEEEEEGKEETDVNEEKERVQQTDSEVKEDESEMNAMESEVEEEAEKNSVNEEIKESEEEQQQPNDVDKNIENSNESDYEHNEEGSKKDTEENEKEEEKENEEDEIEERNIEKENQAEDEQVQITSEENNKTLEEEEEEKEKEEEEEEEDDDDDSVNFVESNVYKYSILIFLNTQNNSFIEFPNTGIKISPILGNCLIYECNNANMINAFRFNIQDDKLCFIKLNLKDDLKLHELFHQTVENKNESSIDVYSNLPNIPITNRTMGTNRINEIARNAAFNKINVSNKPLETIQTGNPLMGMSGFDEVTRNNLEVPNLPNAQQAKLSFEFFNQNINMMNANLSSTLGSDNLYLRQYIDNLNTNLQKLNLNSMQSLLAEQKKQNPGNHLSNADNPYISMNPNETFESFELEEPTYESSLPYYISTEQMKHPMNQAYIMNKNSNNNNCTVINFAQDMQNLPNMHISQNDKYMNYIQMTQKNSNEMHSDMKTWNKK